MLMDLFWGLPRVVQGAIVIGLVGVVLVLTKR